ncbi:HNH endonuclease [Pseudooceanicola sp. CBS1P-1]|uniref:HNH endonuclease n=1 Tax=Pseudooceanicola albus TaxID=2692189 RepID=A0A6L7GBV3_9RHOB|nr:MULTISPECIES: HNH endonuclease [Pseudooceanicola]MBT9386913.1 HNH endonuclease [Pseudooceanicola endophyticus]MXN21018.1 HNH endonuclease [Pseudooceanicola albus]
MRRNWSEAEVTEALALYLRLPFGRLHSRTPAIIALAERLGRTPSAVALKLTNLAALDDSLARRGMANASATDRRVWAAYRQDPGKVLDAVIRQGDLPALPPGFAERQAAFAGRQGESTEAVTRIRIGQGFFRDMILTSYAGRCALTGIEDPRLLTASHIVGWAEDPAERLNPRNGIALNALHDRAFDRHLITFDEDLRLVIAADVPLAARRQLERIDSPRLALPQRFLPDPALLERHRRRFHARAA